MADQNRMRFYSGVILMLVSLVMTIAVFVVPWFGDSVEAVAVTITGLLIGAEITFWLSVVLLGKPLVDRYLGPLKRLFRPRSKSDQRQALIEPVTRIDGSDRD